MYPTCYYSCRCPHMSHQHTHIQQWLLTGLIHYAVNRLPSMPLVAASSQDQGSRIPKQQLPPTRYHGIPQTVQITQGQGNCEEKAISGQEALVRLSVAGKRGRRGGGPSLVGILLPHRDKLGRSQPATLWTFNSHHSTSILSQQSRQRNKPSLAMGALTCCSHDYEKVTAMLHWKGVG